jgi:hypothetical protein
MRALRYVQKLVPHVRVELHFHERRYSMADEEIKPHGTCYVEAIVNGQTVDAIGGEIRVNSKQELYREFTDEHVDAIRLALVNLRWEISRSADDDMLIAEIDRALQAMDNPKRLRAQALEALEESIPDDSTEID